MASKKKNSNRVAPPKDRRIDGHTMRRIFILIGIFGILTFVVLFFKLWQLQVIQHEDLEQKAITQQTREVSSTANRGTIYDANGAVLAISGSVQNVILSPRDVMNAADVKTVDEFGNARSKNVVEAEKKARAEEVSELIVEGMSQILGIDPDEIREKMEHTDSAWQPLAKKVEDDVADQVRQFIEENGLESCLYMTADSKRYYPYSNLACQVVGFVNKQNQGAYGLEGLYNKELSGENGRIITAKNASGTEMLSPYSSFADAVDGCDVHTTIDSTIQMYVEKTLKEGIQKFQVQNGAFCIVMDPKTGAVLALASDPDYDLNDPNTITDPIQLKKLEKLKNDPEVTEEEYDEAYSQAQFVQWRSKALNTAYEPGSTFKPLVVAAGLEEGVISENDTFTCTGRVKVGDHIIRCSARSGHGTQNLRKAVMNSCNPALIAIGQKIGPEKFYDYWEDFGFTSPTGIELPGEEQSTFWSKDEFLSPSSITELATASFGQRFLVTPIQLITALSSVINGGHLMEPYLIQSVTDQDGNVASYHEPKEIRQVISQETSDLVRSFMDSVVNGPGGTGKNARVPGYSIGGKTGSSQTLDSPDHIIVSFVGFAPTDDPEVIVLLGYDWPKPAAPGKNTTSDGIYISGGNMAAPMTGELLANILDYLGHEKENVSTEDISVTIPRLTGGTLENAQASLDNLGLKYRTDGEGTIVTDQAPSPGSSVPPGSSIVLYLGTERPEDTATMPKLIGLTLEEAKKAMEEQGLYLDVSSGSTEGKVLSQDQEEGALLDRGTTVKVKFSDDSVRDDAIIDDGGGA